MSSESSNTKVAINEASIPAEPKRPTPKNVFVGHEGWISSFVFLHDNVHIVSGSWDHTMRKWDCNTGLLVGEPWKGEGGGILALALSPDGTTIACGREDGGVQRWNTDGEMIEGVWMGHSTYVRSVSWSPSGGRIASGSSDGTILVRSGENGEVEVGPIQMIQGKVWSVAYSPTGDRIASGGDKTICIWDSNTGGLLVGPIEDLGNCVTSVVWSLDNSKLYSASNKSARVFDSVSGKQLHLFEHDNVLNSVALSLKHNLLACVGTGGIAQLWDTESHQPLVLRLGHEGGQSLHCVSFSRNGRYLVCGGIDKKITLWMVEDVVPQLAETRSQSPTYLLTGSSQVDATNPFARPGGDVIIEEERNNIYGDFLQSSDPSRLHAACGFCGPSPHRGFLPPRHLWNAFIPFTRGPPADQTTPLQPRIKRGFCARHTGPQPVTISAARPKLHYFAPRRRILPEDENLAEESGNVNAQAGRSSSAAAQPSSGAVPYSSPQEPQHVQIQHATRHAEEEFDFGCWRNFLHTVCCVSGRPHGVVSAVHPAAP